VPKKKRIAEVALLSFSGRAPFSVICTWKRCTSSAVCGVGRASQELGKLGDVAEIVAAGRFAVFAQRYVLEHAAAKFADGLLTQSVRLLA
jgi:hypothetical protein